MTDSPTGVGQLRRNGLIAAALALVVTAIIIGQAGTTPADPAATGSANRSSGTTPQGGASNADAARANGFGSNRRGAGAVKASADGAGAAITWLKPTLILVPESEQELAPVAAALAAKLAKDNKPAYLLVLEQPAVKAAVEFIDRLDPGNTLVIATQEPVDLFDANAVPVERKLIIGNGSLGAAVAVARYGWRHSDQVVLANEAEPGAVIVAATLAAHRQVPFLPIPAGARASTINKALEKLQVKRATVCTDSASHRPAWARALDVETDWLDRAAAQQAIIEAVGADNVRNIVLARTPVTDSVQGATTWLAPYLCAARHSALVLSDSADGEQAERLVYQLISEQKLRPRSLTILADYDSLRGKTVIVPVTNAEQAPDFTFEVEPCMQPQPGLASSLAIGRIPFRGTPPSSLMFTRGLARPRLLAKALPRMLMLANPNPEYGALPLAETVSRATAKEFRNRGVLVNEFYGQPTNTPAIKDAAAKAQLVIYEGHLGDQRLFEDPSFFLEVDRQAMKEDPSDGPHPPGDDDQPPPAGDGALPKLPRRLPDDEPAPSSANEPIDRPGLSLRSVIIPRGPPTGEDPPDNATPPNDNTAPPVPDNGAPPVPDNGAPVDPTLPRFDDGANNPFGQLLPQPQPNLAPTYLHGLPVVVLQSCYSLTDVITQRVHDSGGVGVIGSVTRIHSASGASFIKAVSDGLVYRGQTIGQAVRDARNYLLCLQDLKHLRGHKEQAKSMRVALSFRLWGDPELHIFVRPLEDPRRAPVQATWQGDDKLTIRTPAKRLTEAKTSRYRLHNFPNTQAAGLVQRDQKKPDAPRAIMPIYFFCLPVPQGADPQAFAGLKRKSDKTPRAVFRVDEQGRNLYVLYFPQSGKANAIYALQFQK